MSGALAVSADQAFWDDRQMAVLSQLGMKNAPKADLALFLSYAQRTGLDPFARQIYMIERGGRWGIQSGIDGLRIIAERSGEYEGQTQPEWCGSDGKWLDIWLSDEPPVACRVGVYRQGFREPLYGVVTWREFGAAGGTWRKMPAHMLAKVAESHALRKAFPNDMSGIYTAEEMAQSEPVKQARVSATHLLPDPEPAVDRDTGEIQDVIDAEVMDIPEGES